MSVTEVIPWLGPLIGPQLTESLLAGGALLLAVALGVGLCVLQKFAPGFEPAGQEAWPVARRGWLLADSAPPAEVRCPICATGGSTRWLVCPDCATPHHAECRDYNEGCAIYGCPSRPTNRENLASSW